MPQELPGTGELMSGGHLGLVSLPLGHFGMVSVPSSA